MLRRLLTDFCDGLGDPDAIKAADVAMMYYCMEETEKAAAMRLKISIPTHLVLATEKPVRECPIGKFTENTMGFTLATASEETEYLFVNRIAVRQPDRRKGVGSSMLTRLFAVVRGIKVVEATVLPASESLALFFGRGFSFGIPSSKAAESGRHPVRTAALIDEMQQLASERDFASLINSEKFKCLRHESDGCFTMTRANTIAARNGNSVVIMRF